VYLKRGYELDLTVRKIDETDILEAVKSAHNELD
jgi:hypothetical protein